MLSVRLRLLRELNDLSQQELADTIGITLNILESYERGDMIPDGATISRLAIALEVPAEYLLGKMVSTRIKTLRESEDLSQQQLAEQIGIAQSSLGNYERGERIPDADILSKLADYFDVSADYLLGRNEKQKNDTVREITGLKDEAIQILQSHKSLAFPVNILIKNEKFPELMIRLGQYISAKGGRDTDLLEPLREEKDIPYIKNERLYFNVVSFIFQELILSLRKLYKPLFDPSDGSIYDPIDSAENESSK